MTERTHYYYEVSTRRGNLSIATSTLKHERHYNQRIFRAMVDAAEEIAEERMKMMPKSKDRRVALKNQIVQSLIALYGFEEINLEPCASVNLWDEDRTEEEAGE